MKLLSKMEVKMKLMNLDKEIPKYFYVFLDFKGDFGIAHKKI